MAEKRTTPARKAASRSSPAPKPQSPKTPTQKERTPKTAAGLADVPPLEWIAAGLGLVLALGVAGIILVEALGGERSPPQLTVRQTGITAFAGGYTVAVEVRNEGGKTASSVVVEGMLNGTETAEATIDYVPARSVARGGLVFRSDPRTGSLQLYAKGYVEP